MKKLMIGLVLGLFIFFTNCLRPYAKDEDVSDYLTYQEIIMSSGKLIKNWTEKEKNEILDNTETHFFGIYLDVINQNVQASYIASVKECMENTANTNITLDVSYSVETNTKVSFSSSGSVSASGSGTISKIKAEASAKAGVEYSNATTTSVKEARKLSITVEPNSQYMVVTKGNLSVTNGIVEVYRFWFRIYYGAFEIVTLQSQYAELEKRGL